MSTMALMISTMSPACVACPQSAQSLLAQRDAFDFSSSSAAGTSRRPGGRRPWMAAVFGPSHGWRVRKSRPTRRSLFRLVGEGAFFWLLFFAPAKKSNSPAGESFEPPEGRWTLIFHQDQDRFALSREFISFAAPLRRRREWRGRCEGQMPQARVKEANRRKGPSPINPNSDRMAGRDFPTVHEQRVSIVVCQGNARRRVHRLLRVSKRLARLDPKTAGVLPAALRVWSDPGLFDKKAKAASGGEAR